MDLISDCFLIIRIVTNKLIGLLLLLLYNSRYRVLES